jgi:predicted house-cleaning noncanonical NTP pyrophosphatase (MazG superfamily)
MRLRFRVEKLIRDKLPAIMEAQGLTIFTRRLDDAAFAAALKDKLLEEAAEVKAATTPDELLEELADVSEALLALAELNGLSAADIEAQRLAKRAGRGGFEQRIYNAAVEGDADGLAVAYYLARPAQYQQA